MLILVLITQHSYYFFFLLIMKQIIFYILKNTLPKKENPILSAFDVFSHSFFTYLQHSFWRRRHNKWRYNMYLCMDVRFLLPVVQHSSVVYLTVLCFQYVYSSFSDFGLLTPVHSKKQSATACYSYTLYS